jgi:3-carboxy-cis,cis-muconate cycloisomerase
LSDDELAAHFSDAAEVRAMLCVEAALATAEARVGVIPTPAAERIARAAVEARITPESLGEGTAGAGVPVPALVAALRAALDDEAAPYVHWGATSQDIVDSGLVLRLRSAVVILEARMTALIARLADMAEAHRKTVMAARTRGQQSTPTTFGLKVAGWMMPLVTHRDRLQAVRTRLLCLSLGGASGTLAALGDKALPVEAALALELDLGLSPLPWHVQRDGVADFAGWLSLVTGTLGKMGQDVILLSQSEVGEVRPGSGGGSSTMPQKSNPIAAETLVTLARFNAGQVGQMHQAMIQEQERGGAAWQLEWLTLPQMVVAAGAALRHATDMVDGMIVDPARMRANLDASNGLNLAEAASFALAAHMPRPKAQALVKQACEEVADSGRPLMDILAEKTDVPVDWQAVADPANAVGPAGDLITRALRAAGR